MEWRMKSEKWKIAEAFALYTGDKTMLENILLGIVSICTFISYFPQIVKSLRTKQAEDLSIGSWILWVVSSVAYTLWAFIYANSFMLIFETVMELSFCLIILICAIVFRNNKPNKKEEKTQNDRH